MFWARPERGTLSVERAQKAVSYYPGTEGRSIVIPIFGSRIRATVPKNFTLCQSDQGMLIDRCETTDV